MQALSQVLERYNRLEERVRALEEALAGASPPSSPSPPEEVQARVWEALRGIADPEVGFNLVEMGLIRDVRVEGKRAKVYMVLTSPTCPLAGYLIEQVRRTLRGLGGIETVEVRLLEEPWRWPSS